MEQLTQILNAIDGGDPLQPSGCYRSSMKTCDGWRRRNSHKNGPVKLCKRPPRFMRRTWPSLPMTANGITAATS